MDNNPTKIFVPETQENRLDLLKRYAAYDRTQEEAYETEYRLGGEFPPVLETYGLSEYVKDIDTKSDDIVFKMLDFVCDHFGHDGGIGMPPGRKIADIIEFCEAHEGKTNCRGLAILLASLLRLFCVRARHITCMPYEAPFCDCHVVVDCLLPSGKRIMLDPTWRLFLKDADGGYVSLEGLRKILIAGEPIFANAEASHNEEAFDEAYYREYMTKNTFRFSRGIFYKDGSDDHAVRRVELIPAGYPAEKFRKAAKKEFVYNDAVFWRMGVGVYSKKCFELQPLRIFGGGCADGGI